MVIVKNVQVKESARRELKRHSANFVGFSISCKRILFQSNEGTYGSRF